MLTRLIAAIAAILPLASPRAATLESGTFKLHKFEQAIGEEKYELDRNDDTLTLTSTFHFRDRNTPVDLKANLRLKTDYTPERLVIQGKTSRFSTIDATLTAPGDKGTAFPIATYAPISVQMALVRYWVQHGRPATVARAPRGALTIEDRGRDMVSLDGRSAAAERFTVRGLVWGRETLWFDDGLQLVAAVTVDDEQDHFEAVRDGWENGLGFFVGRAAEDNMQALADLSRTLTGGQSAVLAVTGATLIDGTDRPPVRDSVILVEDGRIRAAGSRRDVKIPAQDDSTRAANSCSPVSGTPTRTSSKWSGDLFISPRESPPRATAATNSISSPPCAKPSIRATGSDRSSCSAESSTAPDPWLSA